MNVAGELRALYPRVLGKTLAFTRQLADAEDAVQDAIARALATWPETGPPESPEAWLVSVAMNAHRDRLRRGKREERHADALAALADMSPWVQGAIGSQEIARGWKDDLLRLLFACCHPSLEAGEGAALALATVLGLTSAEIALAFDVTPRSMDQRLTRARRRLRERGDYEVPRADAARERLEPVLAVIHLLFNEGYWSSHDDAPIRGDLCRLAIGLGRSLHDVFREPEVAGLLALMILHEARRPARLDSAGAPVPLPDQDRTRWGADAIAEGVALLDHALAAGAPGPYQIEAAISATHCRAKTAADTDWGEIAGLYELLEECDGAAPYADAVRGALLEELGRHREAIDALERAAAHARNAHEAGHLRERAGRLRAKGES
jgi:RNA polymerase sigma-70 factor (ECF subfamily)